MRVGEEDAGEGRSAEDELGVCFFIKITNLDSGLHNDEYNNELSLVYLLLSPESFLLLLLLPGLGLLLCSYPLHSVLPLQL